MAGGWKTETEGKEGDEKMRVKDKLITWILMWVGITLVLSNYPNVTYSYIVGGGLAIITMNIFQIYVIFEEG